MSSRLDLNGDGAGDMMFASSYSGVAVYTATNIRLVTGTWGYAGNMSGEGLEQLGTSFVPPVRLKWTTPYVYRPGFYPPEYNLLPAKAPVASGTFAGVLPQSNFPYGGGYMGFELTEPDGVHYGWLRVENDGSDGMEYYVFGRITGFAYETEPGLPIRVGEIPEPNSCVLALLGAVAALRLSWRS